ncbi:hypothetical protein [Arsenicicoccus piscis]|uniref:Uncharacterized protein n=1 Tax=Arsenicicoccus piscis TaxID=673954 RepID=A0ABQ6HTB1_9MICO|nr:hypothetical protein [Arsenicicoccus piscis]GMA21699.1 hypothetical protein GCM10025862_37200 [Arsenicicoccus piscis]
MTTPTLFHSIHFDDADAGLAFLRAIGFEERGFIGTRRTPASSCTPSSPGVAPVG